jgi:cellulose biosynthesis protein BcsQ
VEKVQKGRSSRDVTRVISFTSGKGGVGKTHTVVNTAIALASKGYSVLVLDADLGLANVDVLLGVSPRGTLHDVLKGRCSLDDILIQGPGGIVIIPAASVNAQHQRQRIWFVARQSPLTELPVSGMRPKTITHHSHPEFTMYR